MGRGGEGEGEGEGEGSHGRGQEARLQILVLETSDALIFGHGTVCKQRVVPNVRGVAVAVLIDSPLPLGCVRVASAHIFHLQMLLLAVHGLGIGRHLDLTTDRRSCADKEAAVSKKMDGALAAAEGTL